MRCRVDKAIHTLRKVRIAPATLHLESWQQTTLCDVLLPLDGVSKAGKHISRGYLSAQFVIGSQLFYTHTPAQAVAQGN
jgi:hypothetical protein